MRSLTVNAQIIQAFATRMKNFDPIDVLYDELPWSEWLSLMFARRLNAPFSSFHKHFWEWLWSIDEKTQPRPYVGVWSRGAAKTSSVEMAILALGARRKRRYGVYVRETQDQADGVIQNIGTLLEQPSFEKFYPDLASRRVNKYGHSRGWRRNRLSTADGFTVDGIGLDTAARGAKFDDVRPDILIFDDIDNKLDTFATTAKKKEILTKSLLPLGSARTVVIAVQNLIIADGLFAQLVDGRADFLSRRIVSGPIPAIRNFTYKQQDRRYIITGGEATWQGQDLKACQQMIDTYGISAFLSECQHQTQQTNTLYGRYQFITCTPQEVPELVYTAVWVDPAVTATDHSSSQGIQIDGIDVNGTVYRLWSWESIATPQECMREALLQAYRFHADTLGVETDQGGLTWRSVFNESWRVLTQTGQIPASAVLPHFASRKAGAGHGPKIHRQQLMLADYETGRIIHVQGSNQVLEAALKRVPRKPQDLADAAYWSWFDVTRIRRQGNRVMSLADFIKHTNKIKTQVN